MNSDCVDNSRILINLFLEAKLFKNNFASIYDIYGIIYGISISSYMASHFIYGIFVAIYESDNCNVAHHYNRSFRVHMEFIMDNL